MNPAAAGEFNDECKRLVAGVALGASEGLSIEKRIMINRGIAEIFPPESPEHVEARRAADALAAAEKSQLHLSQLLTH